MGNSNIGSRKTKGKKIKQCKSRKISDTNLAKELKVVSNEDGNDIQYDESIHKHVCEMKKSHSIKSMSNNSTAPKYTTNLNGFEGNYISNPSDSEKENIINNNEHGQVDKEYPNAETECTRSDRDIPCDDVFIEEIFEEILDECEQENSNCSYECLISDVSSEQSSPVMNKGDKDLSTNGVNMHTSTTERQSFCCSYSKRQSKSSSSSENSNQSSFANCGR